MSRPLGQLLTILALSAWPAPATAQPRATESIASKVAWLANNAVALRSIEPHSQDFADLLPLQQAIGGARFVLLGGSRDAAVVKLKYRLVRFLHQEMGFDVLAYPESLFDAEEVDRAFDSGKSPRLDLQEAIFRFFAYQGQPGAIDIFDYVRTTHKAGNPLHMTGFAPYVSTSPHNDYATQLFRFVDRIDPRLLPLADRKSIRRIVPPFVGTPPWGKILAPAVSAMARLDQNLARLPANNPNARDISFYRQTLAHLASWIILLSGRPVYARPPDSLLWYAKSYRPQSKIVIWSTNSSAGRNLPSLSGRAGRTGRSIPGDTLAREFGAAVYSIAFSETRNANQVLEVLVAGPQPSLAPADDNFESLLHAAGKPYSFIDFRGLPQDHWLRRPLAARFVNGAEILAWPEHYDGVVAVDLTVSKPPHHPTEVTR